MASNIPSNIRNAFRQMDLERGTRISEDPAILHSRELIQETFRLLGEVILSYVPDEELEKVYLNLSPSIGSNYLNPAMLANYMRAEGATAARIQRYMDCSFSPFAPLMTVTQVDLSDRETINNENLIAYLRLVPNVKSLNLKNCTLLTDLGLQEIANCRQLTSLNLYGCENLTDAALTPILQNCPIEHLNLLECFNREGVSFNNLLRPQNLKSIIGDFSGEELRSIGQNCLNIETIDGIDNHVTDEDLAALHNCRSLTRLSLHDSWETTDQGLQTVVGNHPDLIFLSLSGNDQYTLEGLEHLCNLTKLQELNLAGTGVTDEILLRIFNNNPDLNDLDISSCDNVSEETIQSMEEQRPDLHIM